MAITHAVKRIIRLGLLASLIPALPLFGGTFKPAPINGVLDEYIVVLADGVASGRGAPRFGLPPVAEVARSLGQVHGGQVTETWEYALQGFIIHMPEARARKLAEDPRVRSVEQNFWISAPVGDCYVGTAVADDRPLPNPSTSPQTLNCSNPDPFFDTDPNAPPVCRDNWGIDRIDTVGRNGFYSFVNNGSTVHIYMIDTGVLPTHREFLNTSGSSRIGEGADVRTATIGTDIVDCYGHGTHTAAIAAGRTFGIAKNATIHPVRILGCRDDFPSPQVYVDRIIRGMNWITQHVLNHRTVNEPWPSVASMSAGNTPAAVGVVGLNSAAQGMIDHNIVFVQSAGNQSGPTGSQVHPPLDACDWSLGPAVQNMIVAGGIDFNDGRWVRQPDRYPEDGAYCNGGDCGSNLGSCIDIWAPSAHVISANFDPANDMTCRLSGTSMAAPHVAGGAAVFLQSNPSATPAQVKQALRSRGTWGALQNNPTNANYIGDDSDNVIVYADTRSIGDTAPVAGFSISCPGRQCTFAAGSLSSDDIGIISYAWRFGDGGMATGATVQHTFPANFSGPVVLTVTDTTGKTDHLRQLVNVNADAPPTASFSYNCTGLTCSFDSNGSGDDHGIASRAWNFGDNTSGSGVTVSHTYANGGTFAVVLTVTDSVGQTGTQSQSITIGISPPTNVVATASGSVVTITWTPTTGVDGYNIQRKVSSAAWAPAGSVNGASTSFSVDTPSAPTGVVLYRVLSRVGTATSQPSNNDVAWVGTFSDDPIATSAPYSGIKAEHITQIRAAVNALLDIATQLPVYTSGQLDPNGLRGQVVDHSDFVSLMQNLNVARAYAGLASKSFRVTPATAEAISRTQIEDLRLGLK